MPGREQYTPEEQAVREKVIAFLLFLTSDTCRQAFAGLVAPEKLAYELCRVWIENIYVPSTRYLDTLKGDYSQEAADLFEDCFSVEELDTMERFHNFLELRIDMLTHRARQEAEFPMNDTWKNIVRDAGYLLEELVADINERRTQLESGIEKVLLGDRMLGNAATLRELLAGNENP